MAHHDHDWLDWLTIIVHLLVLAGLVHLAYFK